MLIQHLLAHQTMRDRTYAWGGGGEEIVIVKVEGNIANLTCIALDL